MGFDQGVCLRVLAAGVLAGALRTPSDAGRDLCRCDSFSSDEGFVHGRGLVNGARGWVVAGSGGCSGVVRGRWTALSSGSTGSNVSTATGAGGWSTVSVAVRWIRPGPPGAGSGRDGVPSGGHGRSGCTTRVCRSGGLPVAGSQRRRSRGWTPVPGRTWCTRHRDREDTFRVPRRGLPGCTSAARGSESRIGARPEPED